MDIIKNVLINCLGLKKRETLLIVTDDLLFKIADFFYSGSRNLGFKTLLIKYPPGRVHGEEPPLVIAEALKKSDLALLLTSKSLSHTKARQAASKRGVRIASLPGISYSIVRRTLSLDYRRYKKRIENIAQRLSRANKIRVKTTAGTNIEFSVRNRIGFADVGIYNSAGAFGNLPAGEACIAPLEGTAQGVIIVDASIAGFGRLKKPISIKVQKGNLFESSPKKFEKFISKYGTKAKNLAEFGIGLNPAALVKGNILEDEKAEGTSHFAFGTNISFGGKVQAPVHIDAVFYNPQIYLDGKILDIKDEKC